LAEQEVSQAQERFRAGVAGNGDVITALLSLNQARTLRNDALASYQSSRVALARAMGEVQKLP
jgi:outer membrane protein TolC